MNNSLYAMANSLGFTFLNESANYSMPPEYFLIEVCKMDKSLIYKNSRLFSLVRTWVRDYGHYLRVDSIKALSYHLSREQLRFLGSLCVIAGRYDSSTRWNRVIEFLKKKTKGKITEIIPKSILGNEKDPYLADFQIYTKIINFQDERKFMGENWILENNPWIRNRLVMTVSARADLYTYLNNNTEKSVEFAKTVLSIGKSSYYGLKKDIEKIQNYYN